MSNFHDAGNIRQSQMFRLLGEGTLPTYTSLPSSPLERQVETTVSLWKKVYFDLPILGKSPPELIYFISIRNLTRF